MWAPSDVEAQKDSVVLGHAALAAEQAWDRVETELRVGDPVRQLCGIAGDRHADMVVVGSSRSLWHRLCGSVASRLLTRGQWPVIVVP